MRWLGRRTRARRSSSGGVEQLRGERKEHVASLSEPSALRRAVEEARTEELLKASDLAAQIRLRDIESFRGATEVLMLGYDGEVADEP